MHCEFLLIDVTFLFLHGSVVMLLATLIGYGLRQANLSDLCLLC